VLVERARAVLQGRPVPAAPGLPEAKRALARPGAVEVHIEPGEATTEVTVVCPDRVGLLGTVAGVFGVHRLTVRSAVTETIDGVAVTVWTVSPDFGTPPDAAVLRQEIRRALDGSLDFAAKLARREAAYAAKPGIVVPSPTVSVMDGASAEATVFEVR